MSAFRRLASACALALTACALPLDPPPSGPVNNATKERQGGILQLSASDDVRTLDPAIGYDVVSWSFEQMIFNTLVDYDEGTDIVPELAESWEAGDDDTRFMLHLRRDVRFSTGRPFDSSDVSYSLKRLLKPSLHSQGAAFFDGITGASEYMAGTTNDIRGIVVHGPFQLEIQLSRRDPLFLHKLAMPFAAVVDREAVEREGDVGFSRRPVGTGPFMLDEWVAWQRLRLVRNPLYFRTGLPHLDGVELAIGVSDQLAWFKYQRGELDVSGIPAAEFNRVVHDERYRPLLLERTTLRTQYVGLNCGLAPFDRVAVRQALNLAVNKQRILELLDGRGIVADGILPPDMPGYDRPVPSYPYDPSEARQLLADTNLAREGTVSLWVTRDDGALRIAQSLQQDLAAVGVGMAIKPVDFPALIEAIRHPGVVPMFLLGWEADFPDPSNFLTVLLHSRNQDTNNNTFYANSAVDRVLDAADPLSELDRRQRLFHAAEVLILRDAPWIPLFHPVTFVVRNPRVHGYRLHPLRPARIETVYLSG